MQVLVYFFQFDLNISYSCWFHLKKLNIDCIKFCGPVLFQFRFVLFCKFSQKSVCVCVCVCVFVCGYKSYINQDNVTGATCTPQYCILILFGMLLCFTWFQSGNHYGQCYITYRYSGLARDQQICSRQRKFKMEKITVKIQIFTYKAREVNKGLLEMY